ncbi:MAG: SUMF1/EgtB/PvdO family nonheme iron enzyme [Anaerolineae bacterium]|nr:SUMF1/EgtB/PvdO family nonheme iron enzyme [Anaerolineae bacterium]
MSTNRPLKVFLCHSSTDKPAVRELYQKLRGEAWIDPWLDEEDIFPGMDWNLEIQKAIRETDAILVCLSKSSITKEGYVQREIKTALDYADEKPEGTTYIIPIRLDECKPPQRLSKWQYADYFEGNYERALQRLLVSLKRRAASLSLKTESPTPASRVGILTNSVTPIQSQFANLTYVPSTTNTFSNGMTVILIPAGKFIMGDGSEQHSVDIPYDYWMAKFPVTNIQYNQFKKIDFDKGKEDHPVVNVSWHDAMGCCQWLNRSLKKEFPSDFVLRLSTEAEWEKAARGTDGFKYPWGKTFNKNKCNTSEGGKGGTTSVGLYSPQGDSPYGCADMSGNVWEWTHSLQKPYTYKVTDGREDERASGARILRGGSFDHLSGNACCAYRRGIIPDFRNWSSGFRVVVSPRLPY